MLDEANVRHMYARILSAAEMRHTYAALMLGSGATLTDVRDQMGHKSIQVTADVYGRFIPAGSRSAVDALDDAARPTATPAQGISNRLPAVFGSRGNGSRLDAGRIAGSVESDAESDD